MFNKCLSPPKCMNGYTENRTYVLTFKNFDTEF